MWRRASRSATRWRATPRSSTRCSSRWRRRGGGAAPPPGARGPPPPRFSTPLFAAMAQAGETGGVLEDALMRVADQLQKDAALRRQIKAAMIYPTLVVVFAVGVM